MRVIAIANFIPARVHLEIHAGLKFVRIIGLTRLFLSLMVPNSKRQGLDADETDFFRN